MAANNKGVKTIRQAIQPKQVMKFFKSRSLNLRSVFMTPSDSNVPFLCSATTRIPSGFLAIYVGCERKRFLIPTRFLSLPVFIALLDQAGEEYGFKFSGGIALPCEVQFFTEVLKFLAKDDKKYGGLGLHKVTVINSMLIGFETLITERTCYSVRHLSPGKIVLHWKNTLTSFQYK